MIVERMSDTANWWMGAGLWALVVGVLLVGVRLLSKKHDGSV